MTESSPRRYFFHILSSKHSQYICDRSLAKSLLGIEVIFSGLARRAQRGASPRSGAWGGDLPKVPHWEPDFPIGFTPSPSLKPEAVGLRGWRRKGPWPAAVSARELPRGLLQASLWGCAMENILLRRAESGIFLHICLFYHIFSRDDKSFLF